MTEHPEREMAAAYALGALDEEERRIFEAHLASCAVCQEETRAMDETTRLLAHAARSRTPPPGLRDRVLAEARRDRSTDVATAPPGPARGGRHVTRVIPWLAAAASLLVAIGVGAAYRREVAERERLSREIATVRTDLNERAAQLAQRDSLLATVLAPGARSASLVQAGDAAAMRLFMNPDRGVIVLSASGLPPAGGGRTYQLWGITTGSDPVSLGTFDTEPDGRATVTLRVPTGVQFEISAVTEEPAGGSPQPTSAPFLVGRWTGPD